MRRENYERQVARRVSENVLRVLSEKGLKRKKLQDFLNVTPSAVSMKIAGQRPWTIADLCNLSDFTGVPIEKFFEKERG